MRGMGRVKQFPIDLQPVNPAAPLEKAAEQDDTMPPLYSPEWWAWEGPKPCVWEYRPAYWIPGEAWAFIEGRWETVNSSDVGMSARPVTAEKLAEIFPDTPPLPAEAFKTREV